MTFRSTYLLAVALLATGCSHKPPPTPQVRIAEATAEARRELRSLIGDSERAAQADALVVRLQGVILEEAAQEDATRRAADGLDRNRDATAGQFQVIEVAAQAPTLRLRRQALGLRDELARLLTAEEWKKSAAVRRKLLQQALPSQSL
jgi:hypothetical protein